MRELRSHNPWMHNSPWGCVRVQALDPPDDATAYGLEDGAGARLESKDGALTVLRVTDELTPARSHSRTDGATGAAGRWRTATARST